MRQPSSCCPSFAVWRRFVLRLLRTSNREPRGGVCFQAVALNSVGVALDGVLRTRAWDGVLLGCGQETKWRQTYLTQPANLNVRMG